MSPKNAAIALPLLLLSAAAQQLPCDIYAAAGSPCVAAHSTVRALFSAYAGALYQVNRTADGALFDVPVLAPGGYANAAAQDAFCGAAAGGATLPPFNTTVNVVPATQPGYGFRHCDAQGFSTPITGDADHEFTLVPALNGDPSAVSFRSVNFPAWFIAPVASAEPGRLGVVQAPAPADASWTAAPAAGGGAGGGAGVTLTLAGGRGAMTLGSNLTGSCAANYDPQSAGVFLGAGSAWVVSRASPGPPPPPCAISKLYDQSALRNDLGVGPAGGNGGKDRPVSATGLRLSVAGGETSVYAAYFTGGEGYRNDSTTGVATGNAPETIYMVTSGKHFNDGCCFDYGNAETTNDDNGAGTMECGESIETNLGPHPRIHPTNRKLPHAATAAIPHDLYPAPQSTSARGTRVSTAAGAAGPGRRGRG